MNPVQETCGAAHRLPRTGWLVACGFDAGHLGGHAWAAMPTWRWPVAGTEVEVAAVLPLAGSDAVYGHLIAVVPGAPSAGMDRG